MKLQLNSPQFRIERATLFLDRLGGDQVAAIGRVPVESDLSGGFELPGAGEYLILLAEIEAADLQGGATRPIPDIILGPVELSSCGPEAGPAGVAVPPHGSLTVQVIHFSGTPHRGVRVWVAPIPVTWSVEDETAQDGEADFWLPAGRYRAAADTVGSAEVEIRAGEDQVVVFRASM